MELAGFKDNNAFSLPTLCLFSHTLPLLLLAFQDNSLIVGGGDNNIHIMDLESGVFKV